MTRAGGGLASKPSIAAVGRRRRSRWTTGPGPAVAAIRLRAGGRFGPAAAWPRSPPWAGGGDPAAGRRTTRNPPRSQLWAGGNPATARWTTRTPARSPPWGGVGRQRRSSCGLARTTWAAVGSKLCILCIKVYLSNFVSRAGCSP
jgi:hypothetical protein